MRILNEDSTRNVQRTTNFVTHTVRETQLRLLKETHGSGGLAGIHYLAQLIPIAYTEPFQIALARMRGDTLGDLIEQGMSSADHLKVATREMAEFAIKYPKVCFIQATPICMVRPEPVATTLEGWEHLRQLALPISLAWLVDVVLQDSYRAELARTFDIPNEPAEFQRQLL